MDRKALEITHKGVVVSSLNPRLIEKQNLNSETVLSIVGLHEKKLSVFEEMKATDDSVKLRELASLITDIEFKLQDLWGFQRNADFHRFWEVPKCICPKLDNEDRWGLPVGRYYNKDCPVHGFD